MKYETCEKMLDIVLKHGDEGCLLLAARLGNILKSADKDSKVQKSVKNIP